MKRRGLSLVVALALCLNLCPMWTLAAGDGRSAPVEKYLLLNDETFTEVHVISTPWLFDTNGFTLKGSNSTVLQVNKGGELEVRGTVISEKGTAVEVLSGGSLTITEPAYLEGSTCALEVAAGASVQLSAGQYSCGRFPTIQAEDYAALLAEGCAYFDTLGDPLWPVDVAGYTGTITVGPCTSHPDKSYAHTPGSTTHTWTCPYCGTKTTENCTFDIDGQTGSGACVCGNSVTVVAGDQDLVYNGTMQPADVTVTVTLTDGSNQVLARGTDYRVDYGPRQDAGEVTVTVSGLTFNGSFAKTYQISPDQPVLTWNTAAPIRVNYDGSPVEAGDLPPVTIQIASTTDRLEDKLQYSYRKQGDSAYTKGLPTNAGTYEVVVSLPETHNFKAAVSQPVTLIVNKINPIAVAPAATKPTFDYTAQALVTPGALTPAAEKDGAVILFAASQNGPYSTDIPTGVDAKSYGVWYKVEETGSCNAYGPQQVSGVLIQPKGITPNVTLSQSSFVYNGSRQEPVITVEDGTTKIGTDQYTVAWKDDNNPANTDVLKNIGTYTATIQSVPGGNYTFTATAQVKITEAAQGGLSITNQPARVYYGDTFTLHTAGGSEDGTVTWSITSGGGVASIDPATGKVTVNNTGAATVRAERQVPNYGTVSDTWTFTAEKKPVTAVVTAASKEYNGNTAAAVTAVLQSGDLVGSDKLQIKLAGAFEDPNVGTDKKVTVDSSNPNFAGSTGNYLNYAITYPAVATASILKANITNVTVPKAKTGLTYTGAPQALVTAGSSTQGTLEYSLDNVTYSADLPTGTNAGSYNVWYRVIGDGNHNDRAAVKLGVVAIAKQNVANPIIEFTPGSAYYDGLPHRPAVTVLDQNRRVIPSGEYTVNYGGTDWTAKGDHVVTISAVTGGNYTFSGTVTGTFQIKAAAQASLNIDTTGLQVYYYYGDSFRMRVQGGSGTGAVRWSVDRPDAAKFTSVSGNNCIVTVTGTGDFTVEAYREGSDGYADSNTDSVLFSARPKPATAVVTAASKTYDGNTDASVTAVLQSGDLVGSDQLRITLAGTFEDPNVGTDKRVDVDSTHPTFSGGSGSNYNITYPATVTAAITKAAAALDVSPAAMGNLTYDGSQQALITGGSTVGNIGTIEYRLDTDSGYSTAIPTAADAGTHTVWYRVEDTGNYTGIAPVSIPVVIQKATPDITAPTASGTAGQTLSQIPLNNGGAALGGAPVSGSFAWLDDSIQAVSGVAYDVIFTPDDINNYNTVTIQVTPVPSAGGGSTPLDPPAAANSLPTRTTVRNGTASTVLSDADGSKLVQEAVANQSESVVIKPEITGDVTKTEISIPASTVSQLQSRTNAALTVSSPVADVTIPHGALETLAQAGGTVSVAAEQVGQSVVLTLTAGGKKVESVPDGLTLSVPVEEASPGTVAVLVHSDGRREVVRKSVAGEGMLNVPLDGSATIEIVDNSKAFTDVPSDNWAADAVAFASARELFSGTGEDTFGPDEPLSRGMLATVLYSLEGSPAQDETGEFSDVSSDAWYAGGVAWAVANGIAEGYDNGQFGPDDSITREQFVVMVWKYAGSPEAAGQTLAFADADQISDYAQQALCWAVENNILSGCADGLLAPGGPATRAQAALMLKNFMEGA